MKTAIILVSFGLAGHCLAGPGHSKDFPGLYRAVCEGDTNAVNEMIAAGYNVNSFVVEPPFEGAKMTPIFFAGPRMAAYLISKGANPHQANDRGLFPIDYAWGLGFYDRVEYLASRYPYIDSDPICGYPERILKYIFSCEGIATCNVVYVSLNGREPSSSVMEWIRERIPNAVACGIDAASLAVRQGGRVLDHQEWKEKLRRERQEGTVGVVHARLTKCLGRRWRFSVSRSLGPLAGDFSEGLYKYFRKYKCWIVVISGGGMT